MGTEHSIHLSAKQILEKDFKTGLRGYQQDEVDKFLDLVIKDYEAFQKQVEQLQKENAHLKKELEKAAEQPKRSQSTLGNTNYDILKRLSNLEKHVFGSKLYD
jgi:DivIVA domain-containing protein